MKVSSKPAARWAVCSRPATPTWIWCSTSTILPRECWCHLGLGRHHRRRRGYLRGGPDPQRLSLFASTNHAGKCFPCRMGMSHLSRSPGTHQQRLEGTDRRLVPDAERVGENMQAGSLCGHGQLGFNPVSSALRYFGHEFDVSHSWGIAATPGICPETQVFSPAPHPPLISRCQIPR